MDNQRLTLVGATDLRTADRRILYYFDCACGNYALLPLKVVDNGNTKSCGCLKKEVASIAVKKVQKKAVERAKESNTKHGMRNTKFYKHWNSMRSRCNDVTNPHYGGRGIKVCEQWDKFENFYADMYTSYVEHVKEHGHGRKNVSIERIDVNGNYEPTNCRWATAKEQALNTRRVIRRNHKGQIIG